MTYLQFLATVLIAIITFVSQKTLSNVIAGILLRTSKPFTVKDRITVTQIHNVLASGQVVKISALSTKIKTYEKNIVSIPNAKLLDDCVIINVTADPRYNYPQTISFTLDTDVDLARELILAVVVDNKYTDNNVKNTNLLTSVQNGKLFITYNVRTSDNIDDSYLACEDVLVEILRQVAVTDNVTLA